MKGNIKYNSNKTKVTIIGGGNIGTQFACVCASKGYEANLFTSKPKLFDGTIEVIDEHNNTIYVRDKNGVNAAFMICEMFAYYKTIGISLLQKLEDIYNKYGYCMNTLHSYEFEGSSGMVKIKSIMSNFRKVHKNIGHCKIESVGS